MFARLGSLIVIAGMLFSSVTAFLWVWRNPKLREFSEMIVKRRVSQLGPTLVHEINI